jgi:hypothetical protein
MNTGSTSTYITELIERSETPRGKPRGVSLSKKNLCYYINLRQRVLHV